MRHILDQIADYINKDQIQSAYDLIITNEESLIEIAEYWNLRGILCLKVEEYNTAISCLSKAIELDESNGDFYYNYAYAMDMIGAKSDASLYYGLAYRFIKDEAIKEELSHIFDNDETLRNIFLTAALGNSKKFIILSSNFWRESYQRTHHIARSLRKFGHEVCYIEKLTSTLVENNSRITNNDLLRYSLERSRKVEGVNIYNPIQLLDQNGNLISGNYVELVQFLLNSFLADNKDVVIISYLPGQVNVIEALEGDFFHIYECVDDHSDLEYAFWGNKDDSLFEQKLMNQADAITTTATSLFLQRYAMEKRSNTYLSKNAVNELDFLSQSYELPEDLMDIPEPRIVFAGHVYKRFDERLFYEIVESNPDKSFVIIGSIQEGMLTRKFDNLFLLGEKRHSTLKNYLHYMQIGIVPYIYNSEMDIACDSIKQYEYLACNLPVISTYMPESGLDKIYTFLANTKEEFNEQLYKCLFIEINRDKISSFIANNSWNDRAALICNIASKNVTPQIWKENVEKIGHDLSTLSKTYKFPIFDALCAIYLNIFDSFKFEEAMRNLYDSSLRGNREKFIEKYYISSMIVNGNIEGLKKVIGHSMFLGSEVVEEVKYRNVENDKDCILALAYYSINDIKKFKNAINKLKNRNDKLMFELYFSHLYEKQVSYGGLELLKKEAEESPLYQYLQRCYRNKESIYIAKFKDFEISEDIIDLLKQNKINITGYCVNDLTTSSLPTVSIKNILQMKHEGEYVKVLVLYDANYVDQIRHLAENGVTDCEVVYISNKGLEIIYIDPELMRSVREKMYLRTVVFNKFNAADSNVGALIKYMPQAYKDKFRIHIIYGMEVYTTENIVKIPLWGSLTVSGFATFLYLPKFTFNIEVGHAGIIMKSCGIMDKKDKNSGGNPEVFKKADIVCVASHMQKVVYSSFYAIPEDKYRITGMARNDMLLRTNGRENIKRLLNQDLSSKGIIFNMPTFHVFDRINRVEGNINLNDSFKIFHFNYEEFDDFLEANNMVCISKVHHAEEVSVLRKTTNRRLKNLHFIDNSILDSFGLDLYEILNGADVLITDYSTVYNDFLFMNKPTVFVNTDIEEYRTERGLALEPYEFWTAGPKVQTQEDLQNELVKSCYTEDYYKKEREHLTPVFFEKCDSHSVQNTWEVIDESFKKIEQSGI